MPDVPSGPEATTTVQIKKVFNFLHARGFRGILSIVSLSIPPEC